ncbi:MULTISPECIES: hypothetical protein [Streptomyces]|uniref:hypothetical protein n=1 Tax=Streptomyces TaxID=1883 RepID=UPI00163C8E06|nr:MULTISPECIES: hypothetical protein [Streptomyces]MBC2878100.1 hypothetical protein [Streptomyces sp. TYQ1024]UBI40046.1 hypothetical protein K7I03_28675 [Streptomyces mobaraensis]UKW32626.1 hypothetical protein MCU78_28605 [Streptomyces sp. TYQ1024]
MFGRKRAIQELRDIQQETAQWLQAHTQSPFSEAPAPTTTSGPVGAPAAEVDDFLPPDLRVPSREEIAGMMMPFDKPLVIDGEVRSCPQCGAYRDWVLLSVRDEVWLRCRAGHETLEPRLDAAWYNRHSGPMDRWHPTLEDGLKHLGH